MSVIYWNEAALEANRIAHTNNVDRGTLGPTLSSRAFAIVHLAMYDAYAKARGNPNGKLPAYNTMGTATPAVGAAPAAATAGAAYTALCALYPSQKAYFEAKVASAGLVGSGVEDGFAFGVAVAKEILALRNDDPPGEVLAYSHQPMKPHHRPDPDNPQQGFHGPTYGAARLFSVDPIPLDPPPALSSPEYLAAVKQVREKGIAPGLMGTLPAGSNPRDAHETLIGIFWGYDGAAKLGTPPRLYNQIVRLVAEKQGFQSSLGFAIFEDQLMRLFALVNCAMGDAGVLAWRYKYVYDLWRPALGVREHDASMGLPATGGSSLTGECDPEWLPLGAPKSNVPAKNFTPPFPAYPSGHATFGAASLGVTRLFYEVTTPGPDTLFQDLTFVSDEFDGINADNKGTVRSRHERSFPGGLWQMIEENGRSRVYLGVHWVFDAFMEDSTGAMDLSRNIGGVPLGLNIAQDLIDNGMEA